MPNDYYTTESQTQQMQPQRASRYQQQYEQPYQQYQQTQYQAPRQTWMPSKDASSTGSWMITLLLMCIPIINIILLFVWAFGSNTEISKQNWARANLIWILIGILIVVVLSIVAVVLGVEIPYIRR